MNYFDMQQQGGQQNPAQWSPQWSWGNPQGLQANGLSMPGAGLGLGLGQAAHNPQYGQQYGNFAGLFGQQGPFGQQGGLGQSALGQGVFGQGISGQGMGGTFQPGWGQHRQLSQQDIGEVVRQLVPLLPHIVAQAQQPLAAFGYGGIGYGPNANQQRQLTQQDVNEVIRQILPILPQILGSSQGQLPLQAAAMYGGAGQGWTGQGWLGQGLSGQGLSGQGLGGPIQFGQQNPYAQHQMGQTFTNQQPFGQPGWPAFQSAFGNSPNWGPPQSQRQLTPQDVNEVVRQLVWTIPQVIGNLQAYGQQRAI